MPYSKRARLMADPSERVIPPSWHDSAKAPRRLNRPSVRQSDVTRAIKGAKDAGIDIGRVEIEGRKIVLVAANAQSDGGDNEWNEVLTR